MEWKKPDAPSSVHMHLLLKQTGINLYDYIRCRPRPGGPRSTLRDVVIARLEEREELGE